MRPTQGGLQRARSDGEGGLKPRHTRSLFFDATERLLAAAADQFGDTEKAHPSYTILGGHAMSNWPRHGGTRKRLKLSVGELQTFWTRFKTFRQHEEDE